MTANKGYKRSWKNLLLNKRYQLRFTLFMVGLSAVLMAGLGVWVMKEANEATTVAMARVRGEACPKIPTLEAAAGDDDTQKVPLALPEDGSAAAPAPAPAPAPKAEPPKPDEHDPAYLASVLCAGAGLTCAAVEVGKPLVVSGPDCDAVVGGLMEKNEYVQQLIAAKVPSLTCEGGKHSYPVPKVPPEPEHHVKVTIDESSMTLMPPPPPTLPADFTDIVVKHWTCELREESRIDSLEAGRMRILWVMIATGALLVLGLAVYGIKMTHKVAGPLFKVQLYLAKMREGRFDKVYNLRKGDQLVDFYDHFKAAHAGVVQLERDDLAQAKSLIAAAEAAGAGDHEAVNELRTLVARKEKSLE